MSDDLPAILGGRPIRPQGPPDWPPLDDTIRSALDSAWRDGTWGKYQGGHVAELEERLAAYHGVAHALTCGSGTFAVELALRALKVGAGDEVLLAAYDYPGNFLTIHAVGAMPVLVDVHPDNWNLDPDRLEAAIAPSSKAVIVSHLHGGLVPMKRVREIADRRGLKVIEDACQCPGARVDGRRAGAWGDVGVLSFGGSKLLTAGRGGAILTPHADVLQRARLGLHRGNVVCPLSELQAAVLLPQLLRLDERNAVRGARVARLALALDTVPGVRLFRNQHAAEQAVYYKVGLQLERESFGLDRALLVRALQAEGMAIDEGFRAAQIGRSPTRYRAGGTLHETEKAHHGTIVLHHPVLLEMENEIDQVAAAIHKISLHREALG